MKKLTFSEIIVVSSMLFGLFFGAGNLIFPASMGQLAGQNIWAASVGFLITGVGLPLLGVAALGISHENGLLGLSSRVSKGYGLFFTCVLFLTIGPFFAIPRCASVSFTVGVKHLLPQADPTVSIALFSFLFFAVVLFFSLHPQQILTWIGKVLNPLFLFFLAVLILRALSAPLGEISTVAPSAAYADHPFTTGFLEGYNTMDALAGLAFGIIIVNVIRSLGVSDPRQTAKNTICAGLFSSLLMAVIYVLIAVVGAQSRGLFPPSSNGGEALALIADHYFGSVGALILALTVTLACLKTAIGLITSCSQTFVRIFPKGPSYPVWAVSFCILSFLIANLGLDLIVSCSTPVLMFLYPLAIVLIALTLFGSLFRNDRFVLQVTLAFTAVGAVYDLLRTLPDQLKDLFHLKALLSSLSRWIPLADLGLGWLLFALCGLCISLAVRSWRIRKA